MIEQLEYLIDNEILKNVNINGDELTCLCPFHEEKKPSFGINIENGKYNCFSCGESGISFDSFLKKIKENYDIDVGNFEKNNLKILNNKIQRIQINNNQKKEIKYLDEDILNQSDSPLGEYIYNRVQNVDIIKKFEIKYDKYNDRYVIPIRHWNKKLMGIVYRQFVEPKYKYIFGFEKSQTLFGIDKITGNKGIITEGQFDVINSYDNDYNDCVGIMGCKMSETQEKLILNYFDEIILALDNDEHGLNGMKNMANKLMNKIKLKAISWTTNKHDLGELNKEDFEKEFKNLIIIN